ncbi:MAG: MATE family efflux transporter [Planctomycetes bacterium]|nr:MATE family efflux transporter [Planctomycetota bacterium]
MASSDTTLTLEQSSWWRRPAGGREVLQVALPLVVSTLSWTVMTFVDRMFLNQVSGTAMSAAFSASIIWFAFFCLPMGVCSYVNTFVSQYLGDGQPKRIGPSVWQGVWVALLVTPLAFAIIPLAPWILSWAEHSVEATQLEVTYFQILCAGGPALLIATALSAFYSGRGKTWVVMLVDAGVTSLNLVLDYLWIFGYGGFPEMGIAGAGWATVTSLWLKAVIYLVLILRRENRESFQTVAGIRFDRKLFGRLIYFGGPSGVQMLLDVLGFTVFVVLMGRVGEMEAVATTLAFSIASVAFMPIWGFSMGVSILVGQHLGENRDDLAARATWTTLQIALFYMVFVSVLYVFTPGLFLHGFFVGNEAPVADRQALYTMAANLLRIVAAYNVMDAVFMVFVSAVKGAGDTRFVMLISLIMGVLLATLSWLTISFFKLSVYGCWMTVAVWVGIMGVIFLLRFLGGKWRSMRVIEARGEAANDDEAKSTVLAVKLADGV